MDNRKAKCPGHSQAMSVHFVWLRLPSPREQEISEYVRDPKKTVEDYVLKCQLTNQARRDHLPILRMRNGKAIKETIRQSSTEGLGFLLKEKCQ